MVAAPVLEQWCEINKYCKVMHLFTLFTRCVQPNTNKCLYLKDSKHACYLFYTNTELLSRSNTNITPFFNYEQLPITLNDAALCLQPLARAPLICSCHITHACTQQYRFTAKGSQPRSWHLHLAVSSTLIVPCLHPSHTTTGYSKTNCREQSNSRVIRFQETKIY